MKIDAMMAKIAQSLIQLLKDVEHHLPDALKTSITDRALNIMMMLGNGHFELAQARICLFVSMGLTTHLSQKGLLVSINEMMRMRMMMNVPFRLSSHGTA